MWHFCTLCLRMFDCVSIFAFKVLKMWIGFSHYFLPKHTLKSKAVCLCLNCCWGVRKVLSDCLRRFVQLLWCCLWYPMKVKTVFMAPVFSTSPNCWDPHFYLLSATFSLCFSFALLLPLCVSSIFFSLYFPCCSHSCLSCSLSVSFSETERLNPFFSVLKPPTQLFTCKNTNTLVLRLCVCVRVCVFVFLSGFASVSVCVWALRYIYIYIYFFFLPLTNY